MRGKIVFALMTGLSLAACGCARADWWQTPEQQAAEAFEQGDHERLLQQAPDAGWSGLGHYQSGDFSAAAEAFAERAEQLLQDGELKAANQALYNQGVSDVRAGRFEEAIEQFEAVLDSDPAYADAAHNRDIAEQLQEIQQQQQQPQDGEDGQQGEQGEQGGEQGQESQGESGSQGSQGEQASSDSATDSPEESGQDSSDTSSGEQGTSEASESSQDEQQGAADSQSGDGGSTETEEERKEAAEAAQRALEAESQEASEELVDESIGPGDMNEQPLSESEQATEQLLRRIPDDPAGLLRRRLQQSHLNKYPEVGDGREAW